MESQHNYALDTAIASKKFPAAIRIKYRGAGAIVITTTTSTIIIDGNTFVYENKRIDDVVSEINAYYSNKIVEAFKLIHIGSNLLKKGNLLSISGDIEDGNYIVRMICVIYKYNENADIRLLPPSASNQIESWYARISNGSFKAKFGSVNFANYNGIRPNSTYLFGIPEYKNQDWSFKHGPPYKDITGEKPQQISYNSKIGLTVLRVSNTPILYLNNISILIKGIYQPNSIIRYVDAHNGLIYLNGKYDNQMGLSIDYTYKENNYVYDAIDLNITLSHNPLISDAFIAFYLKPINSDTGIISGGQSLFHEVLNTNLSAKLRTSRVIPATKNTSNPIYEPVLYIGSINVRHSQRIEDIEIIDTRSRGGGIYQELIDENRSSWKHSEFYFDIGAFDGISIPGNAGIVINIPERLKNMYHKDEIRKRVSRDIAMGIVPIINGIDT